MENREKQNKVKRKSDYVKVTSIARRISFNIVCQRLGAFLSMDLFIIIAILGTLIYGMDVHMTGEFFPRAYRMIEFEETLDDAIYIVKNEDDVTLYQIEVGTWISIVRLVIVALLVVQLLDMIELAITIPRKVRKYLKPINEIALRAQQLSDVAFDETKYHDLQNAISNYKVDSSDREIHMHDKDLQGIETALNDLIGRIRASYKQQTRFVSDASHELRTPIAVIQGYVNMLDRWGKDDEAILDEAIQAIKNESNHMQKLVEQLLFLARGDSNRQTLDMKNHLLNDIMREVYEESLMIDEKHHYIFKEKGTVEIYGDADMLKQSARILVDNAAKYTADGQDIIISVGAWSDGSPFYSIQDDGIGMSQEDVEHAFDRFYRADEVRNSKTGGTGLGLSIAKWIVDKHQGYYDILSRVGIGTRFSVIFPNINGVEMNEQ